MAYFNSFFLFIYFSSYFNITIDSLCIYTFVFNKNVTLLSLLFFFLIKSSNVGLLKNL
jgi:hypothetical protein